mgnify:CR=1 FL=1
MSDVIKCQYAGDPNDEYCKTCNGVTMLVEGEEYPCTECTAYIASNDSDELPINQPEEDTPLETAEDAEQAIENNEIETSTNEDVEEATERPSEATDDITVVDTENEAVEDTLPDGVTVKSIRYMSGMTVEKTEKNGSKTYYKFTAEEEWEVEPEVGADSEKLNNIREKLWAKVNLQVDTQVGEALDG